MSKFSDRLALHMWTLHTTPLPAALDAARQGGFNAVELRHIDFASCIEAGMRNDQILDLIRASGVRVAVMGTEYGLIFADGAELKRLLGVLDQTCINALALGCDMIMIAPGQNTGSVHEAATNFRRAGEIVASHGLRFALEFNSQHDVLNKLEVAREILALADHPACGLLIDAYHLERSGSGGRGFEDLPAADIFTFQYSDVPHGPPPGQKRPTDRLLPGKGRVQWREVFQLLHEKGYAGHLSFEAPNPAQWERPAAEVAREAAQLTRQLLSQVE
jgi:sugar phosphate isomerase/epimerase